MILPPFFGYPIPSKDREPYRIHYSYLGQDIHTYHIPTETSVNTYLGIDLITFKQLFPALIYTYLGNDTFTYNLPKYNLIFSYLSLDCLTYKPPSNYQIQNMSLDLRDDLIP